jgi:hypothetical protein
MEVLGMIKTVGVILGAALGIALLITACPVPENEVVRDPVESIEILKNQSQLPDKDGIVLLEGHSVVLGVQLYPLGVQGGIHWQSSRRGIVAMSGLTGPELTVSGLAGGRTIISVLARNIHNEVYARAELSIKVIPCSFFTWDYLRDGWISLPPDTPAMIGKLGEILVRSGDTAIGEDPFRGGLALEGPGVLVIGSGMATLTNSPFRPEHPVYDKGASLDFWNGPKRPNEPDEAGGNTDYDPFWTGLVRISVQYEMPNFAPLRIQVNNNSLMRNNASALMESIVTELTPASPRSGTLTGVFNTREAVIDPDKAPDITVEEVLSHSFVCLALPEGKVIIRNIRIESDH